MILGTINLLKRRLELGMPVRNGLLAEYVFTEGTGRMLYDYSGNRKNAILGSSPAIDTNDPAWVAEGLQFSGDDYLTAPNLRNFISTGLTLLVVYKVLGTPVGNYHGLLSAVCGDSLFPRLFIPVDGSLRFQVTANAQISKPAGMTTGAIAMLTGTYDGANIALYKNAELLGSANATAVIPKGNYMMVIGCGALYGYNTYFCNGVMMYALIYNRAISSDEVSQIYSYLQSELLKRGVSI